MRYSLVLSCAVVLASALSARATTVTYTGTAGPTAATPGAGTTGSFNVPQYSGAETLVSVQLTITGNTTGGSNGVENLQTTAGGLITSISIGTNINVAGPAALVVLTLPQSTALGIPVTAFDSSIDFGGTSGYTVSGSPATDTQSDTIVSGLAPYIGGGNVTFNYSGVRNTSTNIDFSPFTGNAVNPNFDFAYTVVYTTEVPEPASLGLLGLGAVGLLAKRRKLA